MKTALVCTTLAVVGMLCQSVAAPPVIEPPEAQGHLHGLSALVTMRDGTVHQARIEGVGCTQSICSRTAIVDRTDANTVVRIWFDAIAEIREITPTHAVFVMKDGTTRHLALRPQFRVLYFEGRFGAQDRVDFARVRSIEAVLRESEPR